ncbi:hypothetical protein LMTR3_25990 [Bradyrhizobium sp. LMTR 3]|nr:hypothetical protein LMTR3_25990 [Bradyrhizobium sp. LMTR 3]
MDSGFSLREPRNDGFVDGQRRIRAVPTIYPRAHFAMVGTRSLSSGAHSRDPLALPTLQLQRM